MKEIWVEKYRPAKLDEIVGQDDVVSRLKAYVRAENLPHLLFAGPAGTGKTTCAIALARELFGEDWRANLFELNASDERGLDVVRLKITKEGMDALVYIAQGDMRKAVNALQVAAAVSPTIDEDALYKAASVARPELVKNLLEVSLSGDFIKSRDALDSLLIEYGLSGEDVIRAIHRTVFDLSVPDAFKVRLIDRVGEAEFRLVEGSNERIQLEALLAHFVLVGQELRKK